MNQLKNNDYSSSQSISMLRFGETKLANEKFYAAKKPIKILDVYVENILPQNKWKQKLIPSTLLDI